MSSADALAALGLTDESVTEETVEQTSNNGPDETTPAEREEVEIGELEFGTLDFIPSSRRSSGGSKYKFDSLSAPVVDQTTSKTNYSYFKVSLVEGIDANKLKRSVQSATTQANKTNPDKYFVTRTVNKDGNLEHMLVIRTDARPVEGEDDSEA